MPAKVRFGWDIHKVKCIFIYVRVCACVNVCAGARGGQKNMSDPLELEVRVLWVLGTELWSSCQTESALNY